jgi:CMP-N,N'-diacetyllegionaminic acid synthase
VRCLGVIPARGGSKGIPRKNLSLLGGRPLIAWTCDAARAARQLTDSIVTTDDAEIASVARECGIEVPFLRPAALASDEATMLEVLRHAVGWWRAAGREPPEAIVLLQPTSPFRRADHVDRAVGLLESTGADTVVSVVRVPHNFAPVSLMRLSEAGELLPSQSATDPLRRQDKPVLYARNGPAVLALRAEVLESGDFYAGRVRGLEMTVADSIDIDGPEDLELAEQLIRARGRSVGL